MGTSNKILEVAELTTILARQAPNVGRVQLAEQVQTLFAIAARQHKRAEDACNYGLTPRQEHALQRDSELALNIGVNLGFNEVRLNGDPRGYPLYFKLPGGLSNSWNGEEWGIS